MGDALAKNCDTVLSTGAIQSNYMRTLAAAAAKLGLECHIQLEDRVKKDTPQYRTSGNRLLSGMLGATIHHFPHGEDEQGADRQLRQIADELAAKGKKPYVVPLTLVKESKGALGYVAAAEELLVQFEQQGIEPDMIVAPSGNGNTHAGLLFGLRVNGCNIPVTGVCVRRNSEAQAERIRSHCGNLTTMFELEDVVAGEDIILNDAALEPGYGEVSNALRDTIFRIAAMEGIFVDPVYSGKTFDGAFKLLDSGEFSEYRKILLIHTGGTPAIFAYQDEFEG
jgi:1-aminocyclopropane-1-carboxylate deaminase/D-cysteine desulfhydrase-like pyridoxal-dependent ACC family enzyme